MDTLEASTDCDSELQGHEGKHHTLSTFSLGPIFFFPVSMGIRRGTTMTSDCLRLISGPECQVYSGFFYMAESSGSSAPLSPQ